MGVFGVVCIVALAADASADDPPTVRAMIDKSDPSVVLLDSELPAGTAFTLELLGATADDQVVVTIEHGRGRRCTTPIGHPLHELAMIPIKRDDAVVMQAKIPRLQIRETYCIGMKIFGGLPSTALDAITAEVMAATAPRLATDAFATKAAGDAKGDLADAMRTQLSTSLAPQLRARGLTAAATTANEVAAATADAFMITTEAIAVRTTHADRASKTRHVEGTPAAGATAAKPGTGAQQAAANASLLTVLGSHGSKLRWPDDGYAFVIANGVMEAARVWDSLDEAAVRAAVAAQIASRRYYPHIPRSQLKAWSDELARTTTATRAADAPELKPPGRVDVWLETRAGLAKPGFLIVDATLAEAGLTAAEWRQVEAQLRSLALALSTRRGPAIEARAAALAIADAIDADVDARAAHDLAVKKLDDAEAAYQAAVKAATTRLQSLLRASLGERRFRLSAERDASGRGVTTSLENWVSINVGVAAALPFTRPRDTQTDMDGDVSARGWLVPYFAVNVHAPQERTIPPGRLVDEFWQRVCLTGGILITNPDPIDGHEIEPVLFSRAALLAVGVRVTPYSRITAGTLFYRIQNHTAGGDPSLGLAPFIGYSLDIDAVKLVKDGFSGL